MTAQYNAAQKKLPVWFIPAIVFGVILAIALFIAILFFGLLYLLKNSDAYKISETNIRQNAEVRTIVGDISKLDSYPSGNVQLNNGGGTAEFTITVDGTTGSAVTFTKLHKDAGKEWVIDSFEVNPVAP